MSQTVTENLFNHDVSITTTGGIELTVDLSATPWNRTTIADGWWLQNRTNSAFSARDIYLANCIDEINDNIANIRDGYINSLISMNNVVYSANDYWDGLPPTIAPSNTSMPAPSNTLTYMTVGEDTDLGTEDISLINDRTCIIQGNLTENSFNQILMNTDGLFYRSVSSDTVNSVTGEKIDNYDLLETNTRFSQILDDSTINTPGYWFLHKETSGRPVWTNINALAEYIDNRVNPDEKFITWSGTYYDDGMNERKLTIMPPNEDNINTDIDPTQDSYANNAYLWTDGGWAVCNPLISRQEAQEKFDNIEAAAGDLREFLSLFIDQGAVKHYTNYGWALQSEAEENGVAYFGQFDSNAYDDRYFNIDLTGYPAYDGRWNTNITSGAPRRVYNLYHNSIIRDGAAALVLTAEITANVSNPEPGDSLTSTFSIFPKALIFKDPNTNDYKMDRVGDGTYLHISGTSALCSPVYIGLAPFVFLKNTDDGGKYYNIPRDWHIHFNIKGCCEFPLDGVKRADEKIWPNERFYGPAYVDVSIVLVDKFVTGFDGITATEVINTSKTYEISYGDFIGSKSYFTDNYDTDDPNGIGFLKENIISGYINKEIDFHQSFSAGEVEMAASNSNYVPYLRVCVKGLFPVTGSAMNADDALGIEIQGKKYDSLYSKFAPKTSAVNQFIEEFTDDRFMEMAYRYVNNLATRNLSFTDENDSDSYLGYNFIDSNNTNSTNILGQ